MPGKPQQPPRVTDPPVLLALLWFRYRLHLKYPVSAGEIARALLPADATQTEQRSLAAAVLRLFRDGSGRSSARWAYFEMQIRLGVPESEQAAALAECAELYRSAFPYATDCPPPDATAIAADTFSEPVFTATAETFAELMTVMGVDSMFNPCRNLYADFLAKGSRVAGPGELVATLAECEQRIDAMRQVLRKGRDRLRQRLFGGPAAAHEQLHRDMIGTMLLDQAFRGVAQVVLGEFAATLDPEAGFDDRMAALAAWKEKAGRTVDPDDPQRLSAAPGPTPKSGPGAAYDRSAGPYFAGHELGSDAEPGPAATPRPASPERPAPRDVTGASTDAHPPLGLPPDITG